MNLSIIGLVRKRFPESFAHAQTVDTGPLFPPPTWPGYEATAQHEVDRLICATYENVDNVECQNQYATNSGQSLIGLHVVSRQNVYYSSISKNDSCVLLIMF